MVHLLVPSRTHSPQCPHRHCHPCVVRSDLRTDTSHKSNAPTMAWMTLPGRKDDRQREHMQPVHSSPRTGVTQGQPLAGACLVGVACFFPF